MHVVCLVACMQFLQNACIIIIIAVSLYHVRLQKRIHVSVLVWFLLAKMGSREGSRMDWNLMINHALIVKVL